MKNKKILKTLTLILLILSTSFTTFAHPGRTDANGGHYDKKTEETEWNSSISNIV